MATCPINFQSLTKEEKQEFFDSFDTVLSDCDGVLWNDSGVLGKAAQVFHDFIGQGKRVFYVTNNSTKTKKEFLTKFQKLGFPATEDNVCNTASLAATYFKENLDPSKSVYIVGAKSLAEELDNVGIKNFGAGREKDYDNIWEHMGRLAIEIDDNVGAVLVGFDEHICYVKMLKATTYVTKKDCLFVCTNKDETYPAKCCYTMPGTGAVVAGIEVAVGRPPFVLGKPSTYLAEHMTSKFNVDPKRTLFIGDRCNTDMLMGNKCSFKTLLVLSGVHSMEDVKKYQSSNREEDQLSVPHYYTNKLDDLIS